MNELLSEKKNVRLSCHFLFSPFGGIKSEIVVVVNRKNTDGVSEDVTVNLLCAVVCLCSVNISVLLYYEIQSKQYSIEIVCAFSIRLVYQIIKCINEYIYV